MKASLILTNDEAIILTLSGFYLKPGFEAKYLSEIMTIRANDSSISSSFSSVLIHDYSEFK